MTDRDPRNENEYDGLRWAYKPEKVQYLLVGESPPDPGNGPLRFFYAPQLRRPDNLYLSVATAVFGSEPDLTDKPKHLSELQRLGWWLVDAVSFPINRIKDEKMRRSAIHEGFRALCGTLNRPDVRPAVGAIICMPRVFQELAGPLRKLGICVLHDYPIEFPMAHKREAFIQAVRSIARSHPSRH